MHGDGALKRSVGYCGPAMTKAPDEPAEQPRRSNRVPLSVEVTIRRAGFRGFRVRAFDLSPDGCKIEFVERPAPDETVWVKFDDLEAIEARVCWVDGHIGGLEFVRPLYLPVFERISR